MLVSNPPTWAAPDNGIFSPVEQIEQAARIAHAIKIPLIVDADTVGETVADAFYLTRRFLQAGIAGFHIEDEVNPKHSSYDNGLIAIPDMQAKIQACVKAREGSDFVIIARCDELYPASYRGGGGGSLDHAIDRGRAYIEAGADALVFPLASPQATADLLKAIPAPIGVLGFNIPGSAFCLHTGWGWISAAQAHLAHARSLFETGEVQFDPTFDLKTTLIEQGIYDELVGAWAKNTGRKTRALD
jgi:2-methylisocitrate lyase-like PEP mutase family enzyme